MDLLLKDKNKIIDVVNNIKTNKLDGGSDFFDKIDEFVRNPKNIDMIYHIFDKIKQDKGVNFNLIITGKFGDWIYNLIKIGKIKLTGVVIHVSGSLRTSVKNKTFQIIGGNENNVYNKKFILLDDSYYSGSTKKEIDKHLNKYHSKIIKTYVLYDGSFQKKSDVYSVYRYYDYHINDVLPIKKLLGILNGIDEKNIPYDLIENQIMKGQIRNVKELLNLIKSLKLKFGSDNININSYGYKREYENRKLKKYKMFLNEELKGDISYLPTQFWHKYLRDGRESIRILLSGKNIEFHTKSNKVKKGIYNGRIIGLMVALSKKFNKIIILFKTREFGVLEVNVDFPIIIRYPKLKEGVRWYKDGKLGDKEHHELDDVKDITTITFKIGDKIKRHGDIELCYLTGNEDDWVYNGFSRGIIEKMKYVENVLGYTGWLVKLKGHWPWWQTTNMVKEDFPHFENEGVRWYKDGKLGDKEHHELNDIKDYQNPPFEIGDRIKRNACHYWDSFNDICRFNEWMITNDVSDRDINDIKYNDDPKAFHGYIGWIVKLSGKWPWFRADEMELLRPKAKNEAVRWYVNGKLGEREKIIEPEIDLTNPGFNVGDVVELINPNGSMYYWFPNKKGDEIYGEWVKSDNLPKTIIRVKLNQNPENYLGYIGQLMMMEGKWPWYKTDNLKKRE